MADFKDQIDSDIREYQEKHKFISNISKPEWAFNFWVLDKLFYEDEECIEDKIIDYNDMGIDCYEVFEDTKDIYLIQNKYFSENTRIRSGYVKDEFLIRGITALESGSYTHSPELQQAFNKLKGDPEFTVHLQLFITNNQRNSEADEYVKEFNRTHSNYIAEIFYLDDIKNRYYNEVEENHNRITVSVESVNNSTILKINTADYHLNNPIDARYVFTPVVSVYRMYRDAIEKHYPIFEKNIREYLGNRGINKRIYKTLEDKEDRKNFFYYNNGITIICDSMSSITTKNSDYNMNASFTIDNPQIVNGCQTVNSIYEYLKNVPADMLEEDFKDTFVMLKILVIDRNNESENSLYKHIVKYNNSQNRIDVKTFEALQSVFLRLQEELEKKGLLLLIKQSDKNTFSKKYKKISKLKELSSDRFSRFELNEPKKVDDFFIPLDKLLQVINAFELGGAVAYTKKSQVLVAGSVPYNTAVNFIKDDSITNDVIIDLYMLYKKAEQTKKESKEQRYPIPYYLIDFFAKYDCNERDKSLICEQLKSGDKISDLIERYKRVSIAYCMEYDEVFNIDYNKMIKRPIRYDIAEKVVKIYKY